MKQYEIDRLNTTLTSINEEYNTTIKRINNLTSNTYTLLEAEAVNVFNTKNKIAVLSDMLTDLKVIKGRTSTSTIVTELPIISKRNVTIENGSMMLSTTASVPVIYSTERSSITSTKPYKVTNGTGTTKTLTEVFRHDVPTKIVHQTIGYDLQIVLEYPKLVTVNNLVLKLPDIPETYPFVEGISYTLPNTQTDVKILDIKNGTPNYDLDLNRELSNEYSFNFDTVQTNKIILRLSSKNSNTLDFTSIKTYYNKYEIEGEVVLGPIVSDHPILKLAMNSQDISTGVKLYISTNNLDWVGMTDVVQVDTNVERKVASFNTINESSFKSEADVRNIYVKVVIRAEDIEGTLPNYQPYSNFREDGVITTGREIEPDRMSAYALSTDDLAYGQPTFITNFIVDNNVRANIETLKVNGTHRVLGFDDTKYSVCSSEYNYSNVEAVLNLNRVPASSLIDASGFDAVTSFLCDINLQFINSEVNIKMFDQACAKIRVKEDTYKIVSKNTGRYVLKNVSKQFIENSHEFLYQVPNDDLIIKNSLGVEILTVSKENLLEIDGVYFINMLNIFSNEPKVDGYSLNPLYPLVALEDDEYALEGGKIILGKGTVAIYTGYKTIKTKVPTKLTVSYQNGNIWERQGTLYTYHHEQIEKTNREASIIKLDHVCIEKGSLTIYEYNEHDNLQQADTYISVNNTGK